MQPATRHDIALLLARSLAVFALFEPFLTICSTVAAILMVVFAGHDALPDRPPETFQFPAQYIHFVLARLLAFSVLWFLAPRIARWISSVSPVPVPTNKLGSDVAGTPWAGNPGHTAK